MKRSTLRIAALCVLLILALSLMLSSCRLYFGDLGPIDMGTEDGTGREENNVGDPSSDGENMGEDDATGKGDGVSLAYAAAQGLRSSVSIYCAFERASAGSFWDPNAASRTYSSVGAGVIWEADEEGNAFLVTNFHVVYDGESDTENSISDEIYAYLYGMEAEEYAIPASYVGGSAYYDIAVLRVDASEVLKAAVLSGSAVGASVGDSNKVTPGDAAIVVGNPSASGLGGISVTSGVISVDSEYVETVTPDGASKVSFRVMRTDAPVNAGNSGGGLFDDMGKLIGIVNMKPTNTAVDGVGYVIPASIVRGVTQNIIDNCYDTECESVLCAVLGVTVETSACATVYDPETGLLYRTEEVRVVETTAGSLADGVLLPGDIQVSVRVGDGETVSILRRHHLIDAMLDARVGDTVTFIVLRDGVKTKLNIIVTEDAMTER